MLHGLVGLCDKSFSRSSNLQRHKRVIHSRPYYCRYCGMLFTIHTELKRHVRAHSNAKPYSCRHCSERFRWLVQLNAHLLKSHNEGTWFTCDICQKKFCSKHDLKVHVQRHEAVKPYVCCECPKRFYTADELRQHRPEHSEYKHYIFGIPDTDLPIHYTTSSEQTLTDTIKLADRENPLLRACI